MQSLGKVYRFGRAGYADPVRGKEVVLLNFHFGGLKRPGVVMHFRAVQGVIRGLGVEAVAFR